MDLGNLNWSVEVDTSDLSRAEREMSNTREAAEGGRRATERMGREAETAGRRTRTATQPDGSRVSRRTAGNPASNRSASRIRCSACFSKHNQ